MNFTLALLGGLTLILPGLVALMAVHLQSGRHGARRIDLPITSTLGLVVVLSVSMLAHLLGWALFELGIGVARELQGRWPPLSRSWGVTTNPYEAAVQLAEGGKAGLGEIVGFLATVAAEAGLAVAIVMSRGFVLVAGGADLGNQGWLFQKIILPIRHGLQPVAYVLTVAQSDGTGLGYRGVIVEARQNADGELKGLTLNGVETYTYRVPARQPDNADAAEDDLADLRLSTSRRRPLAGVLVLESSQIRNVLIVTIPDDVVSEILRLEDTATLAQSISSPLIIESADG